MLSQIRINKLSRIRRFIYWSLIALFASGISLLVLLFLMQPGTVQRTEIFRGVFLTVKEAEPENNGSGRIMIVEVHWDTHGIRIGNRPFSFPVDTVNPDGPHYRLVNADWALFSTGASVLMNTTRYTPDNLSHSIPGRKVRSVETVVAGGMISHVHEHSYLMYLNRDGEACQLTKKPPDPLSLSDAVWGIGVQGVQVYDGQPRYQALGNLDDRIPRSFIGLDPKKKILYLIAFQDADGRMMIEESIKAGVVEGGMVDSGNSTSLLVGRGAKDIPPHAGIRGWRPLGGYLIVNAERLNE